MFSSSYENDTDDDTDDDTVGHSITATRTASAYVAPIRSGDIAKIASEGRLDDLIALHGQGYNCMYGFMDACKANQTHVIDFLLDHYTPNIIDLNMAVTFGRTSVVERMLRDHPSSAVQTGAIDPIRTATAYKRWDILPLLSAKV